MVTDYFCPKCELCILKIRILKHYIQFLTFHDFFSLKKLLWQACLANFLVGESGVMFKGRCKKIDIFLVIEPLKKKLFFSSKDF